MRFAVGVLLFFALLGCGTSEAGSRAEPTCYYSYDASYTPMTMEPHPLGTPGPCVDPNDTDKAYDSTLEVEWDESE